ncbi:hypothetical protein HQ535_07295 [bacterium]|nr:hypothetical protein [bacterium]
MKDVTRELWAKQDQHKDDHWRLFRAISEWTDIETVLYPGSFVDIAPSFLWPSVTYLDSDRRAETFFSDRSGVKEIIRTHRGSPRSPKLDFIRADYTLPFDLPERSFDFLISLYAGFVSEHCSKYLKVGGTLLVNSSHGDAAMATLDPAYQLAAVVITRSGDYRIDDQDLDAFLIPKTPVEITPEYLHERGKGILYTRSPFAYLFRRIS